MIGTCPERVVTIFFGTLPLSEYELQRLQNIADNNAMLAALGLADGDSSLKPKAKPKVKAQKRPPDDDAAMSCTCQHT